MEGHLLWAVPCKSMVRTDFSFCADVYGVVFY